jgi:hypothetical protein
MSDVSGAPRLERSGEGWRYVIDASHAPAYALFTVYGSPSQSMIEKSAADLLDLMDRTMGEDAPFCPVVVDVRKLGAGKMGAATLQWASSRALRRVTRLVIIFDPDFLTRQAYAGFLRVASVVLPNVEVVYSCEEAFERLDLDAPADCRNHAS